MTCVQIDRAQTHTEADGRYRRWPPNAGRPNSLSIGFPAIGARKAPLK